MPVEGLGELAWFWQSLAAPRMQGYQALQKQKLIMVKGHTERASSKQVLETIS